MISDSRIEYLSNSIKIILNFLLLFLPVDLGVQADLSFVREELLLELRFDVGHHKVRIIQSIILWSHR